MVNVRNSLGFAILLLFALTDSGSCLQCYDCGEQLTSKFEIEVCKDPFTKMASVMECEGSDVCVKHQKLGKPNVSPEMTIRGCANKDYCYWQHDDYEHCSVCSSNLCNAAPLIFHTFQPIILIACLVKHYFL